MYKGFKAGRCSLLHAVERLESRHRGNEAQVVTEEVRRLPMSPRKATPEVGEKPPKMPAKK